jgi:MFS family permease
LKQFQSPIVRVFLPFALGYYLSYLFRIVNAVIAPDLMASIGIGPSDLGLLTAAFFLSFALFQLPLGLFLDRYGPRRVEAILLVIASAGALIFGVSHSLTGLVIGRSLIGLGVSACLMAAFTAFASWFPGHRLPLINGLIMAAGGLGAISATTPVQRMLHVMHWRSLFFLLAGITLFTAWIVFRVVPEKPHSVTTERFSDAVNGIWQIFSSRIFWGLGIWATASQASFLAIIGLWIGPWLRDVGGLDRENVASSMFQVTLMMVFGYIFTGKLTGALAKKGFSTLRVAVIGMGIFMMVQAWLMLNITAGIHLIWLLFGFTGTSGVLCYAELTRRFSSHLAGRVNTALNLLVFVAAFAGQWGIGAILERYSETSSPGGAAAGYQIGFGLLLAVQILGLIWYAFNHRLLSQGRGLTDIRIDQ